MLGGSDEQKQRFLPDLASGQKLGGVRAHRARRRQRPRGDGDASATRRATTTSSPAARSGSPTAASPTPSWCSPRPIPTAGARCQRVRPRQRTELDGFTATAIHGKLGIRGSNTAELHLDEVVVPAANRLGEEGSGFGLAMRVLDRSRPGVAAQALGSPRVRSTTRSATPTNAGSSARRSRSSRRSSS